MRQLVQLNNNLAEFDARKATLIAISPDSQSQTSATARKLALGFPLVSDPDNALARRYAADIKGAAMYWIRPDGRIQYGYTDPPNYLDRPPLAMVLELTDEAADPERAPRTSEFDAPCRPNKGEWLCP